MTGILNIVSSMLSKFVTLYMRLFFPALLIIFPFCRLLSQDYKNVDLLDHWYSADPETNSTIARFNDCWGFEHKDNEYAVLGSTMGAHIFRVADNDKLIPVDFQAGDFTGATVVHRDYKTYRNYLYAVCDEGNSSLQIFDLNSLPDSIEKVNTIQSNFGQVHNIFIDTTNAILYACIVTNIVAGAPAGSVAMRVLSLADPLNPVLLYTGPNDIPEVHDCYVRDNIAYLNCGFDGLRVYDFSNPANPLFIQSLDIYHEQGYNHQGWMSPDGKTYIFGDETMGKRLKKCSVENTILNIDGRFGSNHQEQSVPHNIFLTDNFAYVAYYNEGLRIFDSRKNTPVEVAHYDTYPQEYFFKMNGAWGIYRFEKSGRILVSDRQSGLYLFSFDESKFVNSEQNDISIFPNPVQQGEELTVYVNQKDITNFDIAVYDLNGRKIKSHKQSNYSYISFTNDMAKGMYIFEVNWYDNRELHVSTFRVQVI